MNDERLLTPAHGEAVYLTGDVHGRFDRVISFCLDNGVTKGDALRCPKDCTPKMTM